MVCFYYLFIVASRAVFLVRKDLFGENRIIADIIFESDVDPVVCFPEPKDGVLSSFHISCDCRSVLGHGKEMPAAIQYALLTVT